MPTDLDSASPSIQHGRVSVGLSARRDRLADRKSVVPEFLDQLLLFPRPEPLRNDSQELTKGPESSRESTRTHSNDDESRETSSPSIEEEGAATPVGAVPAVDPQRDAILSASNHDADKRTRDRRPVSDKETYARQPATSTETTTAAVQVVPSNEHGSGLELQQATNDLRDRIERAESANPVEVDGAVQNIQLSQDQSEAGSRATSDAESSRRARDEKTLAEGLGTSSLEFRSPSERAAEDAQRLNRFDRQGGSSNESNEAPQESSRSSRRRNDRTNARSRSGASSSADDGKPDDSIERANHLRAESQAVASGKTNASEQLSSGNSNSFQSTATAAANPAAIAASVSNTAGLLPAVAAPTLPLAPQGPTVSAKAGSNAAGTPSISEAAAGGNASASVAPNTTTLSSSDARTASGPAGATGTSMSHYQETKLVQRVLRGMEQLANGGGQVRLRLHPPELGALQMSLRIEGQVLTADMQVETAGARDALMKNLPLLKERLSEQGIVIQQFDVRTDNANTSGGSNAFAWDQQQRNPSHSESRESQFARRDSNRRTNPTSEPILSDEVAKRWTRTNGLIDVRA